MVTSVNNGIAPQIPAANTFKPGEVKPGEVKSAEVKKSDNFDVTKNTASLNTDAPTEIEKSQEADKNQILAKDNSQPTEELLTPPAARGSTLDISV